MAEVADPLAVTPEDPDLAPRRAVGALARQLVAPQRRVARHADQVSRGRRRRQLDQEGDVGVLGRAHAPARRRLPGRRHGVKEHARPAAALDRELVAELAIEPRDAGDGEHALPPLGAPAVDHLELRAHQPLAAALGHGADQLRLAHRDRHAAVRPGVRQQVQARDDGAGAAVGDHGGVLRTKRGMPAADEIACPGGERTARLRAVLGAQHVADERGQGLFVVGGGASEHEAVTQVPDHVCPSSRAK